MKKNIEFIARGIVMQDGKVLLCKNKKLDHYFFPGGHVEFNEFAEEALKREIKEETGAEIKDCKLVGILENVFKDKKDMIHEINFIFKTKIDKQDVHSLENHLDFCWVYPKDLANERVLPVLLKKELLNGSKVEKDIDDVKSNYYRIGK